ncbi:hypothetical protein Glove_162g15 [Diversispora epigaea]|uniref:Uncharacterized protein n=1 Tax=Diversispora epigaea TaxID=1348612 RepID=A0A397IXK4_9GLOM|nr:hypothetical protein Glove_162g15 [Diversispora epigaea]
MYNEDSLDKVWGIVTDLEKWYFMECLLDGEGKPSFKLSKHLMISYEDENIKKIQAEKIIGHIIWLLEEAQKPFEDGEQSKAKKITHP